MAFALKQKVTDELLPMVIRDSNTCASDDLDGWRKKFRLGIKSPGRMNTTILQLQTRFILAHSLTPYLIVPLPFIILSNWIDFIHQIENSNDKKKFIWAFAITARNLAILFGIARQKIKLMRREQPGVVRQNSKAVATIKFLVGVTFSRLQEVATKHLCEEAINSLFKAIQWLRVTNSLIPDKIWTLSGHVETECLRPFESASNTLSRMSPPTDSTGSRKAIPPR